MSEKSNPGSELGQHQDDDLMEWYPEDEAATTPKSAEEVRSLIAAEITQRLINFRPF